MRKNYYNNNKDEVRIGATRSIGELITLSKFSDKNNGSKINLAIKHSTIFSFWTDIVGAKFANITRPSSIRAQKLYVSAKSPVVIQELNLYKQKIIRKLNSYSGPLGIEIKDIVFNYKNYAQNPINRDNLVEDKPKEITPGQLETVKLEQNTISKTKEAIDRISFLNEEQKEKLANKIILAKKASVLRESRAKEELH